MKKRVLLGAGAVMVGVGVLVWIVLEELRIQNIITTSSNLTFTGPGTAPALDALDLEVDAGNKLIFAAVGGGPGAKPASVDSLDYTKFEWQVPEPGMVKGESHEFSAFDLPNQVQAQGYSLVVIASYTQPVLFWENTRTETRLFWFDAAATGAKQIRFEGSEPLKPHP